MNIFEALKKSASIGICAICLETATIERAEAYPIDCAILLCLAGGFPASAECSTAKTEFIRRITPFPIEPPLQIWRCPMSGGATFTPISTGKADIDVSGPAFDYIRSVRVFHIDYRRWETDTNEFCVVYDRTREGGYDNQGAFSWRETKISSLPEKIPKPTVGTSICPTTRIRGVGVEWLGSNGSAEHHFVSY